MFKNGPNEPSYRRFVYPTISRNVVKYLQAKGMELKKIGALLDLSESFISRVGRRERSFTLEHLDKLEKMLKKPLPIILIEAVEMSSVPKDLRNAYKAFKDAMAEIGDLLEKKDRGSANKSE
jgi:DNA-binding transcriptional MerR regulator